MKNAIIRTFAIVALLGFGSEMKAVRSSEAFYFSNDSISPDENIGQLSEREDSIRKSMEEAVIYKLKDTLDLWNLSRSPYISVQQYLKGSVPGAYVQETTGEPGSMQNMLFRGVSTPIFSKGDVASTQPVVFLNGIPLLMNDAFVYNVKSTEVNPIGTATNILSGLNLDNVASIEVVKDAAQLAKLGPLAANGAVFDYFDQELSQETLEMLVHQAETIAHSKPSGLDAKTCLSDQAISFTRNIGFKEIEVNLGAYLVIADTGIHGNTREAVEKVEAIGLDALSDLNRLGELSQQAEEVLKAKDQKLLGQLMSQAHNHLKSLGVSCDLSDLLVATALEQGALGAKMSGGGLGGCIIALTSTKDQAQTIAKKLQEKGAVNTWIESL